MLLNFFCNWSNTPITYYSVINESYRNNFRCCSSQKYFFEVIKFISRNVFTAKVDTVLPCDFNNSISGYPFEGPCRNWRSVQYSILYKENIFCTCLYNKTVRI